MATNRFVYEKGSTLPNATITCEGAPDLTSGTLSLLVGPPDTPTFTKTTGLTGAVDGTCTVDWTTSDLGALTRGVYPAQLRRTVSGEFEAWTGEVVIQ